jgi:hypothetical protein
MTSSHDVAGVAAATHAASVFVFVVIFDFVLSHNIVVLEYSCDRDVNTYLLVLKEENRGEVDMTLETNRMTYNPKASLLKFLADRILDLVKTHKHAPQNTQDSCFRVEKGERRQLLSFQSTGCGVATRMLLSDHISTK